LHYEILSIGSGMRSVVKISDHGRLVFIGGGERGLADLG
jgi:hypothetical protein